MQKQILRRGGIVAVIMACLGWGGYQYGSQALSAEVLPRPGVVVSDGEVARAYPGLPIAVARAERSVVAIQQILDKNTGKALVASGVIVDATHIVTAGHNVESGGTVSCHDVQVITPGLLADSRPARDLVSGASVNYGISADVAMLTVQTGENFQGLPDAHIASRPPAIGQTVYFINYQPTADGLMRSPLAKPSPDPRQDYSKPAIFAGIVVGSSSHGVSIVTGYGKSLGRGVPDTMIRKGASGGAVVNADGELIGVSVSSESLQADLNQGTIKSMYGYELPDGAYQLAYMQPVGRALLERLQSSTIICD